MNTILKTAIVAIVIASGAATASADPLLKDLASKGAIVTVHGIAGSN
ncbi:MAG: hypothetical protein H6876_00810 [Hyphomicrobiaceae bacterium]|nr:hypothetical protein [Hyphomicrobiaceae bacterium]MCC0006656.1 hypothetical protein [Hyphomicrobiaceae bacterium]